MKARNTNIYLLISAVALLPCAPVSQAQSTQTLAQNSQPSEGDITTVTVFGKLQPPTGSMTIDGSTASNCSFITSQSSSFNDAYIGRSIRSDTRRFDVRSPNGDASGDQQTHEYGGGSISISRLYSSTSGDLPRQQCSGAERSLAAGRAEIIFRDTTLAEAFELFNAKEYTEALSMFEKSYSKIGYHQAGLMIAKMHLYGLGTEKNVPTAIEWFEKVSLQPNRHRLSKFNPRLPDIMTPIAESSMTLAKIYLIGFDVPKNPKAARKWFERAYEVGYVPAGKTLGDIYYFGYDTPRDLGKALKHYTNAAEYGYAPAQYALANILYSGEETIKANPKIALDWYWHAAKQKHPGATYAVARAYDLGENVKADPDRALSLYKEAAIGGDGDAQNALGTYFYNGQILPKDQPTARKWFEAAAVRGQVDAMFNLAVMMMKGEGGDIDHTKAYAWLTLAQTAGHPNAEAVLKILEGRMTPAEKAAADALLAPKV